MEWNILYAILIMVGVVIFVRVIKPYLRKNNFDFYEEIKLFLIVSGYAFRDEKVKSIAALSLNIVEELEKLTLVADEKHYIATDEVFRKLLDEFNIELPAHIIEGIVRIATAQLSPTNTQIN